MLCAREIGALVFKVSTSACALFVDPSAHCWHQIGEPHYRGIDNRGIDYKESGDRSHSVYSWAFTGNASAQGTCA
jgi:hypothetical protein